MLADHPDIGEVSVIGREHPKWGETPIAVVVANGPDVDLDIEATALLGLGALARYKLPTGLEFVEELPRNAAGKVLKPQLRDQLS